MLPRQLKAEKKRAMGVSNHWQKQLTYSLFLSQPLTKALKYTSSVRSYKCYSFYRS